MVTPRRSDHPPVADKLVNRHGGVRLLEDRFSEDENLEIGQSGRTQFQALQDLVTKDGEVRVPRVDVELQLVRVPRVSEPRTAEAVYPPHRVLHLSDALKRGGPVDQEERMAALVDQLEGQAVAEAPRAEAAPVLAHQEGLLCLRVRLVPHRSPSAVPLDPASRFDVLLSGETCEPLRVESDQDLWTRTLSYSLNERVGSIDTPAVEVHEHRTGPCL